MDQKFLNGTQSSSTDPGTHNILFVQVHDRAPDAVLVTVAKIFISTSLSGLNYSFVPSNINISGFTLKTQYLDNTIFKSILLAYMTVVNNYGIELVTLDLSVVNSIYP
jgi:hypothetical protein